MVVSRASQVRRAARIFVGPGYGGPHRSSFFADRVNDSDLHVVTSCGRIFTTGPDRDHGEPSGSSRRIQWAKMYSGVALRRMRPTYRS